MVDGVWAEQRLVFYFQGNPHYLMAYSKIGDVKSGDVVPNELRVEMRNPSGKAFGE